MRFLSQYSYVILSAIILIATIAYAVVSANMAFGVLATLVTLAVLVIWWVGARRGAVTPVNPEKRIRRARGAGRPLVVHFYSDWSLGSLLRRPFTAKTERTYKGPVEFLYISMTHHEARLAASSVEADLGDWLLFDAAGNLVERTKSLTEEKVKGLLKRAAEG